MRIVVSLPLMVLGENVAQSGLPFSPVLWENEAKSGPRSLLLML